MLLKYVSLLDYWSPSQFLISHRPWTAASWGGGRQKQMWISVKISHKNKFVSEKPHIPWHTPETSRERSTPVRAQFILCSSWASIGQ